MSAFLGPIHHWLYNKINLQDRLTDSYLKAAESTGMSQIGEQIAAAYGLMPKGKLEDLIDESNIHGWLQNKISLVENRYAMTVTAILKQNPDFLNQLLTIASDYGAAISSLTPENNALDAYKVLNDILIDGMPCDHVNMLIAQDENEVIWKRTQCVHEKYWIENGSDVAVYYQLRTALVQGILSPSGLRLEEIEEDTYSVRK